MMERHQELVGWQRATDLSVATRRDSQRVARSRPYGLARDPKGVEMSPSKIAEAMGNSRHLGGLNPES